MQRFIPEDFAASLRAPVPPDPSAPLGANHVLGTLAHELARQREYLASLNRDIQDLHARGQADADFLDGVSLNVAP